MNLLGLGDQKFYKKKGLLCSNPSTVSLMKRMQNTIYDC